jgi:hypothetical protein
MQSKKLSLLIPKHQNKTAKEIAQMYLTHSSKPSDTPDNKPQFQKPEKLLKSDPQSKLFSTKAKPESKPSPKPSPLSNPFSKFESSPKEDSCFEILSQFLQHRSKTSDLQESNFLKEQEMLESFISTRKSLQIPLKKLSQSEIIQEFKEEALNMDKKISSLSEENKNLKEKLALAMIEEVDERLRREKPCDRLIEAYSNKTTEGDPDPPLVELFSLVSGMSPFSDSEAFELKVDSFFNSGESHLVYMVHLCQQISNDRKRFKKQEIENSRILRLKREVVFRLSKSIENRVEN